MQEQKRKQTRRDEQDEVQDLPAAPTEEEQAAKAERDAELDAFLDEVEDLLEENAEEFVKAYRQRSGQ